MRLEKFRTKASASLRKAIGAGSVDLWWQAQTDQAPDTADWQIISNEERTTADRFRFERDRSRYIRRHAFLRRTLGLYTGVTPGSLVFQTGDKGKPNFLHDHGALHFNLSHCDPVCVLAVTRLGEIGIDVEHFRAFPDMDMLAGTVLHPTELVAYRSCAEPEQTELFLKFWTRKEALLKAAGEGIGEALQELETGADTLEGTPVFARFKSDQIGQFRTFDISRGTWVAALTLRDVEQDIEFVERGEYVSR